MRHPKTLTIAMVVGLFAMGQMPLLMAQQDEEAFLQSDEEPDQDASGMDDQADADAWQADDEMAAEEDATAMDADAPAEDPPEADEESAEEEESAEDEFSDLLEPNSAGLDTPGSGERPADVPASANTDGPAAPMTQTPTEPPSTPAARCGGYGTVRSFDDSKGFGYITPEDGGSDVFVHFSSVNAKGFRSLQAGQRVAFDCEINAKGQKRATTVTPIAT